jgi:hypothetical protein
MERVNKFEKKIKDSHGFCLIINGFIIARPDKIRLSWAISNYHRLSMEAMPSVNPPPPVVMPNHCKTLLLKSIRQFLWPSVDIPPFND